MALRARPSVTRSDARDPTPRRINTGSAIFCASRVRGRGYITALTQRDPSGQLIVVIGASHPRSFATRALVGFSGRSRRQATRGAAAAGARAPAAESRRQLHERRARRERAPPPAQPSACGASRYARGSHGRARGARRVRARARYDHHGADVHAAAEEPNRRGHGSTAAPLAAAAEIEAPAERLGRHGQQAPSRLARVIATIQRPPALSARLLGRPLDDRLVDGPEEPSKNSILISNGSTIASSLSRNSEANPSERL